jgi:catechol 2,3-dioxygenase
MEESDLKLVASEAPRDPEQLKASSQREGGELSASTRLGPVHLTVASLQRSIEYYLTSLGLKVLDASDDRASVGVGDRELLVLVEEPGARSSAGYTGLYHFALLVPERVDLARWLAHAARARIPLVCLSDHFVSEAIYLADPDSYFLTLIPSDSWSSTRTAF